MSAKFACIACHRKNYPVVLMCRVLAVSPSGFYAAQQRVPSVRAVRDEQLTVQIRAAHQQSRRRHGVPRVHYELTVVQGERVGKKRVASMSRRGNCWDNAVTESFFATFKVELVHDVDWATREEARRDIFEFLEIWYNRERRHSSLGYDTPVEYEQKLMQNDLHGRRAA